MKLSKSLLLPILLGTASATQDADVYIFQGTKFPKTSPPSTLSPEQARLVLAQRLGASQFHGLGKASDSTISYINQFGGIGNSLFQDAEDQTPELVLIVEGVTAETAQPLLDAWSAIKPAFSIAKPPSATSNKNLVMDLMSQTGKDSKKCYTQRLEDAINPFDGKCWEGRSKVIHFDLAHEKLDELMTAEKRLLQFAKKEEMNVVVVLMPDSTRLSKASANPYGTYEKATQLPIGNVRRNLAEEPITEASVPSSSPSLPLPQKQVVASNSSSNSSLPPLPGLLPVCHSSLDDCIKTTRNCSGHGSCYKKYADKESKSSCFACGCFATKESFSYNGNQSRGYMAQHWGGAACQKKDVSESFWLLAGFSVVLMGLVSWAIGLMYSIGEEKLPGVIGAGVSSKAR